jgi:type III secretion system chaperone SycN
MDWLDNTLAEFGRQLELPDLRLNAQGAVRLTLASGKPMSLEPLLQNGQQEVLVTLGLPVGHEAASHAQAALKMAHAESFPPLDIQLALFGQGADALLIATTRLPARAFTVSTLSGAVHTLDRWLDSVASEGALHG